MAQATPLQSSLADLLRAKPETERRELLSSLTKAQQQALLNDWRFWRRPEQVPPSGDWLIWYIKAGRGWGKTLTAAHLFAEESNHCPQMAIVAATLGDGRDTCVEGESGLQAIVPGLQWNRGYGEMTFPSGCKAKLFSGEEPERLRGPNNYFAWCDEIGSWRYQAETWKQLMYTLRKGKAQAVLSTTPRPSPLLKDIQERPTTVVTKGRTTDNLVNLSAAYYSNVVAPYVGTRDGRQELDAEDLEDVPGALWKQEWLDVFRVTAHPKLTKIVVGVDPSVQGEGTGDACGIVVAGVGIDGHGYVLDDVTLNGSPLEWGMAAVAAFNKYHATALIAEANNGGALVQVNIGRIAHAPPVKLVHAADGKKGRAQPVANLDQQGRIHHVGRFVALESEMTSWVPDEGKSPNRIDARVWAMHELQIRSERIMTWA